MRMGTEFSFQCRFTLAAGNKSFFISLMRTIISSFPFLRINPNLNIALVENVTVKRIELRTRKDGSSISAGWPRFLILFIRVNFLMFNRYFDRTVREIVALLPYAIGTFVSGVITRRIFSTVSR